MKWHFWWVCFMAFQHRQNSNFAIYSRIGSFSYNVQIFKWNIHTFNYNIQDGRSKHTRNIQTYTPNIQSIKLNNQVSHSKSTYNIWTSTSNKRSFNSNAHFGHSTFSSKVPFNIRLFDPNIQSEHSIRTFNPNIQSEHLIRTFNPNIQFEHSIQTFNSNSQSKHSIRTFNPNIQFEHSIQTTFKHRRKGSGRGQQPSAKKRKYKPTWTRIFVCLASTGDDRIPSPSVLGAKKGVPWLEEHRLQFIR